jgi:hypothetical protein
MTAPQNFPFGYRLPTDMATSISTSSGPSLPAHRAHRRSLVALAVALGILGGGIAVSQSQVPSPAQACAQSAPIDGPAVC